MGDAHRYSGYFNSFLNPSGGRSSSSNPNGLIFDDNNRFHTPRKHRIPYNNEKITKCVVSDKKKRLYYIIIHVRLRVCVYGDAPV